MEIERVIVIAIPNKNRRFIAKLIEEDNKMKVFCCDCTNCVEKETNIGEVNYLCRAYHYDDKINYVTGEVIKGDCHSCEKHNANGDCPKYTLKEN